jgi:hypothetical protein
MRDLPVQLPPREQPLRRGGRVREAVFFLISFGATFLAAILLLDLFL